MSIESKALEAAIRTSGMRPGEISARYVLPEFRERTANGERVNNPYSKLFEERIVFLGVQVDDASADDVMAQLLCLESMDPDREIQIYINSPGGSYTAMTAIYDTMQFIKPAVSTLCMGMAASMGAFLLAAGEKGKRFALPNSRVMIHQPLGGVQGQASDIEIHAREILSLRDKLNAILAERTGQSLETIARDTDRDNFMSSDDALKYGLIDRVLLNRD